MGIKRTKKQPAHIPRLYCEYSGEVLLEVKDFCNTQNVNKERIVTETYVVIKLFGTLDPVTLFNIIGNSKAFVYVGYSHPLIFILLEIKTNF